MLEVVLKHAGERRIVFSCFNPDICTMVRNKQNKYPVMFLTVVSKLLPYLSMCLNSGIFYFNLSKFFLTMYLYYEITRKFLNIEREIKTEYSFHLFKFKNVNACTPYTFTFCSKIVET